MCAARPIPARVSDTLRVEHDEIGLRPQLLPRGYDGWTLAKRQQPRDVREAEWRLYGRALQRRKVGIAQHDGRSPGLLLLEAHIHRTDRRHLPPIPREHQAATQLGLDLDRLIWAHRPGV